MNFSRFIFQTFTETQQMGFPVVIASHEVAIFETIDFQGKVEFFEGESHHAHVSLGNLLFLQQPNHRPPHS